MSYILDALRKSEEERQPHDIATLTPLQRSRSQRRRNPWLTGLVLVLLINGALLGYLALGSFRFGNQDQEAATMTTQVPPSMTAGQGDTPTMQIVETDPLSEAVTIRPSVQNDAVSRILASLTFTSHVYAEDPSLRSVMIDGKVYREGDAPQAGLDLVAITNSGVVLRYQGRDVAYNVLEQWE